MSPRLLGGRAVNTATCMGSCPGSLCLIPCRVILSGSGGVWAPGAQRRLVLWRKCNCYWSSTLAMTKRTADALTCLIWVTSSGLPGSQVRRAEGMLGPGAPWNSLLKRFGTSQTEPGKSPWRGRCHGWVAILPLWWCPSCGSPVPRAVSLKMETPCPVQVPTLLP